MKKALLIIGITVLVAGILFLGASVFFNHMAHSIMDGTASLYQRLYRRRDLCMYAGIGLSLAGAAVLILRRFKG